MALAFFPDIKRSHDYILLFSVIMANMPVTELPFTL
jgi:hypothetical protein